LRAERTFEVACIVLALRDVNVIVNGSRPDVVLVETNTPQDFLALEALANAHPEIDFVLVGNELSPEFLMRAMRAGVREVLPAPAAPEDVLAALRRLLRKRAPSPVAPVTQHGEVLALVSCKGGSGATFVAANLAHLLAAGGRRRVGLIDMNLQFGDAALFVSSETPQSNVADVARNIDRLDADLLRASMAEVAPGLWVLAAPDDPAPRRRRHAPARAADRRSGTRDVRLRDHRCGPFAELGHAAGAGPGRSRLRRAAADAALHPRRQAAAQRIPLARLPGEEDPLDRQPIPEGTTSSPWRT
jgi:DNA-binding response OmpR family regulator